MAHSRAVPVMRPNVDAAWMISYAATCFDGPLLARGPATVTGVLRGMQTSVCYTRVAGRHGSSYYTHVAVAVPTGLAGGRCWPGAGPGPRVRLGDSAFDDLYCCQIVPEAVARAILEAPIRARLMPRLTQLEVGNDQLLLKEARWADPARLRDMLDLATHLASRLDGALRRASPQEHEAWAIEAKSFRSAVRKAEVRTGLLLVAIFFALAAVIVVPVLIFAIPR